MFSDRIVLVFKLYQTILYHNVTILLMGISNVTCVFDPYS